MRIIFEFIVMAMDTFQEKSKQLLGFTGVSIQSRFDTSRFDTNRSRFDTNN